MGKGIVVDLILVLVMTTFLAICIIVGYDLANKFYEGLEGTLGAEHLAYGMGQARVTITVFNYGFIAIIGVLGAVMFILGMLIPSHPIFIVPFLLVWIITIFFSGYFSNMYYDFVTTSTEYASIAQSKFGIVNYIMTNLPFFSVFWGVVTLIATYGISRMSQREEV